jgi:hypothetical protein
MRRLSDDLREAKMAGDDILPRGDGVVSDEAHHCGYKRRARFSLYLATVVSL